MKVPFSVSARTARLIGRENIASSKGAIIELVKNSYDADSPFCIVYFSGVSLYIIDAGDGMTQSIIKNHWMTIGTNNKEEDFFTKSGRVKAGAKGIGRFALDKLGSNCEMLTIYNPEVHEDLNDLGEKTRYSSYFWKVSWDDFEGEFKTIDKVGARLVGFKSVDLKHSITQCIDNKFVLSVLDEYGIPHGTVLKISNLRDIWNEYYIDQLYSDLEVLIPPRESSSFRLFVISENYQNKYGEVMGSICDDYDYKLIAKADEFQNVSIKFYRNEYDIETVNPKLFERDFFKSYPYTKEDFQKGFWETNLSFRQLLPGFVKDDKTEELLNQIGTFEFTFYYMKRAYANKDAEKFFYNKFNSNERKGWLNKFGGIKIFRDDFRVRPYGEVKDSAFDWLMLGARKVGSPASITHPSGSWKVEPDNVAGAIHIKRVDNVSFMDKSSREGLQEHDAFRIFQQIILRIISKFEEDRAKIAREMMLFYETINYGEISKKAADDLAKRILANSHTIGLNNESDSEKIILAKAIKDKEEEIEILKDEQILLRGMASSGIVIASFAHELNNINNKLGNRIDNTVKLLSMNLPCEFFDGKPDFLNPYNALSNMREQDEKMKSWLNFALASARKDKRKRRKLIFAVYFNSLSKSWESALRAREINLSYILPKDDDINIKAFELDFDTIFNNLIVNSIDSFLLQKVNPNRTIRIITTASEKEIIIDYYDNGNGISSDINEHDKIFESMYTTKRNLHTGEEIGTGLGMWMVKTVVKEYGGYVKLIYPEDGGFGIRLTFVRKYVRG